MLIDIGLRLGQVDGAFVKCTTNNDTFDTRSLDLVELDYTVHVGNAARGDHRNADRFRELPGGLDINPLHHAVSTDVGVNNRSDTLIFEA